MLLLLIKFLYDNRMIPKGNKNVLFEKTGEK